MYWELKGDWGKILEAEFEKDYFKKLQVYIEKAYKQTVVFPPQEKIFNAFSFCALSEVKVIILGQDPYHKADQAHGLAFSVPDKIPIPPSLRNIYKEVTSDLQITTPLSGNLERWTKQGVLLLNSTLTVEASCAGSHQGLGWERFTDTVITNISEEKKAVVFLLWGASAISKRPLIDEAKHLVLTSTHPSPLSAYRGFLGCKHFSQANSYLTQQKITPVDW